jgi:hypothetical protein
LKFSVTANLITKEADVILPPGRRVHGTPMDCGNRPSWPPMGGRSDIAPPCEDRAPLKERRTPIRRVHGMPMDCGNHPSWSHHGRAIR